MTSDNFLLDKFIMVYGVEAIILFFSIFLDDSNVFLLMILVVPGSLLVQSIWFMYCSPLYRNMPIFYHVQFSQFIVSVNYLLILLVCLCQCLLIFYFNIYNTDTRHQCHFWQGIIVDNVQPNMRLHCLQHIWNVNACFYITLF